MLRHFRAPSLAVALLASGMIALTPLAPVEAAAAQAATDPAGAEGFVSSLANNAFATMRNKQLAPDQRDAKFRTLLRQGFDLDFIARLLLGQYNRTATKAQLDAYYKVFPDYILTVYVSRLGEYADDTLQVTGTAPAGRSDVYVRTELVRKKGEPVLIDWRVRKDNQGQFHIIDVKVEGISLTVTQRNEFASRIASAGMDALIADLKAGVRYDTSGKTN